MPDYIYLLENRLSPAQQTALKQVRDIAREHGMTVFLTGGAIRDLSTGFPVRDLDFSVQGNALKLKKSLEKAKAALWGEHEPSRTLFFWLHGVRVEVSSARRESYPKPGKPVYEWAPILEDLRRRDFTANAMAVSLNEGSYGLLLDPLNGIADIEARTLRLVSPYGFIEDPSRLLRATRLQARTGWDLDERSKTRYQNAKDEESIAVISPYLKGYELEEIGHEEDALKVLKALEHEGWMKHLFPAWTVARADAHALEVLHQTLLPLLIQGIHPDLSAAQMELLTAKLQPKDLSALKKLFPRPGFVAQWEALEDDSKEFQKELLDKKNAAPSATWKLLTSYTPEPVLWLAYTSKNAQVQTKFKNFLTVWPEVRQKIPTLLMLEMRIGPELPGYAALVQEIFFQLMDGKLGTEEEMRAFLEPHSPPAPPPPVSIKRSRAKKSEAKSRIEDDEEDEDALPSHDDDEDGDLGSDDEEEEEEHEEALPKPLKVKAAAIPVEAPKAPAAKPPVVKHAPVPAKAAAPATPAPPAKKAPAKAVAAKPAPPAPAKKAVEAKKPVKAAPVPAKKAAKPAPKPPAKVTKKPLPKPVKKPAAKPAPKAAKKPVAKPAKKKR
jgi:tRNA nucleotidyltransferase (CCA-adding enzyme)